MLREACLCNRDETTCPRIRIWPLRRDNSSRALIGAAVALRSDWHRRDEGVQVGQIA